MFRSSKPTTHTFLAFGPRDQPQRSSVIYQDGQYFVRTITIPDNTQQEYLGDANFISGQVVDDGAILTAANAGDKTGDMKALYNSIKERSGGLPCAVWHCTVATARDKLLYQPNSVSSSTRPSGYLG